MKIASSFGFFQAWWQKKRQLVLIVFAALIFFTVAGTVTADASGNIHSDEVVNVKNFGATGNGLTNDSSAINSAIAALPAANGCLLFPPGNYLASGFSISGKTNLLILGEGATITQSTPANNLFVVDNTCSKVTFRGLFLDGSATARLNGIHIRLAAPDSTVENCIFRKSSDFGLFITDDINTVTNVKVINCLFRDTLGDGVHLGNVNGFVVADCIFYKTGDDSIAPLAGPFAGAGGAFLCQNGVISNNVIIGAGSRGIAVQYARNIKIVGNKIYGSIASGIEVCDDGNSSVYNDYITVENNHLYGCTTSAGPLGNINIFFTKHGVIRGNEVYNPANGVCLAFADVQNTEISGNTFMQVTAQFCRGIMADGAKSHGSRKYEPIWDGVTIVNNVISMLSGSNNECIYLAPANSVIISNIIIAGNNCRNVPNGKYIYTDNLGTAAKIVNNTCLETRTIDNGGHGLSPTMANNN